MWNKYLPILCSLLLNLQNIVSAGSQCQDPVVKLLGQSISNELQNYFGANFVIPHPYDLFFKDGSSFLDRAGITDTALAKVVAEAAAEVGIVSSEAYFDAVGFTQANFLFDQGIATNDNVELLFLSYVTAIEGVACSDGLSDIESVMHAVTYGIFNVLDKNGLINYTNVDYLFNFFAKRLKNPVKC